MDYRRGLAAITEFPNGVHVILPGNELFDELLDEIRDADDIRVMPLEDLRLGFSRKVRRRPHGRDRNTED